METHFLRTRLATDFEEGKSFGERLIELLLFFIPGGNPGYEGRMHLIYEWIVEFDEEGLPEREIGLDINGYVILAGPDDKDYGFWLDTNMKYEDLTGEPVSDVLFQELWKESESYRK